MGHTNVGRAARLAFALAATIACASHSSAQEQAVAHSPWTKFCGRERGDPVARQVCLTVSEARQPGSLSVAGVTLVDPEGETRNVLRMMLPRGTPQDPRVILDQDQLTGARYVVCLPNTCIADVEVDTDVVSRLKTGTTLSVSAADASGRIVTHTFPLGFAAAREGPPVDPKTFEVR